MERKGKPKYDIVGVEKAVRETISDLAGKASYVPAPPCNANEPICKSTMKQVTIMRAINKRLGTNVKAGYITGDFTIRNISMAVIAYCKAMEEGRNEKKEEQK